MLKKLFIILTLLPGVLCGCAGNHKIETASIIENVSVHRQNNSLCYTFYILTDSDTPNAVAIKADSFENARELALKQYIPNMSLAKLELLLIHTDVGQDAMRRDIEYISTQASFSPVAYVALCDTQTLDKMKQKTSVQTTVKNQLNLCRQQHPNVMLDYLNVFNTYARNRQLTLPYISGNGELKVSAVQIKQQN